MSTKYYLAGPMTGLPKANIPAFDKATKDLRERGYKVVSPAELDDADVRKASYADSTGMVHASNHGEFLSRDVLIVAYEVDAIALLPKWFESTGAKLEAFIALMYKKPLYAYTPTRKKGLTRIADWKVYEMIGRHLGEGYNAAA